MAGEEEGDPEEAIWEILRVKGLTISTAESCTGGLLSHLITNVSGSSDYYKGGVVAYANEVKEEVLHVPREIIESEGAVSASCVRAMAEGVRRLLHADIGIATTGIAGPTGGTPEKPVGLVYIGLATKDKVHHERHLFHEDREGNKHKAASAALKMLREYLLSEGEGEGEGEARARSSER